MAESSPVDSHCLNTTGTLPARFAQVVARRGDNTAVVYQERIWTYAELDCFANGVANQLMAALAAPTDRIAIYLEPGAEAIGSILGILKFGSAYVPLDTSDPEPRIRQILTDCQPAAIVTNTEHAAQLKDLLGNGAPVIDLSKCEPSACPQAYPATSGTEDVACVFYTSGSTGEPKGVCQSHRNVLHYIECYSTQLGIGPNDRLSLFYTLSFSASNLDIFGALLNGATLFPYRPSATNLNTLAHWTENHGITVLHMVPSLFRQLVRTVASGHSFAAVKAVDLGGETLFESDVQLFAKYFPRHAALYNHYAATEISVICQHHAKARHADTARQLPVGRPADAVRIRIVDNTARSLPKGQVGNIQLSSPYLSPGYLHRDDLTDAAFSELVGQPGWRCYDTGDEGYLDTQEQLHVTGRSSARLKIRGHSVYPAEVEAGIDSLNLANEVA
ncbi:MAG: AMP-binding protein, partial [Pseudomonadota bacterium]